MRPGGSLLSVRGLERASRPVGLGYGRGGAPPPARHPWRRAADPASLGLGAQPPPARGRRHALFVVARPPGSDSAGRPRLALCCRSGPGSSRSCGGPGARLRPSSLGGPPRIFARAASRRGYTTIPQHPSSIRPHFTILLSSNPSTYPHKVVIHNSQPTIRSPTLHNFRPLIHTSPCSYSVDVVPSLCYSRDVLVLLQTHLFTVSTAPTTTTTITKSNEANR